MNKIKEIINKRYHMYVKTEEFQSILNGTSESTLEFQYSAIAMSTTLLCSIVAFIARLLIHPAGLLTKLLFIIPFFVLLTFFIVGIITQEREATVTRFVLAFSIILFIPIIWFLTGGFFGMGPIWFVLGAAFLAITLSPEQASILLPFHCACVFVTISYTLVHPEVVTYESDFQTKVGIIVSLIIVCFFIYFIITTQKSIAAAQRKKVDILQEEISAQNEELTASNEELTALNEELLAMNEENTEMNIKLQKSMETQRLFSASMTHELRSPLNGIEGCLQMMLMSGTLDAENKLSVENALSACRNLTRNVNDMLDFSKLQEGKFEIIEADFDLREIINTISYLFSSQVKEKNLSFNINIANDCVCSLIGDGGRIQQIMTNLISNSIKYTPAGSVDFSLSVDIDKKLLHFSIKDTGMGMSPESLETLFDPFTRFDLKQNAKIQGTGLGMSIVSNLVKAMHGEITVESTLGSGTEFKVTIPVGIAANPSTYSDKFNPEAKASKVVFSDISFPGKNILCVDDTKLNLVIFKGLLKNSEINVDTAYSGLEALDMVKAKKYDLIFLDHLMPEMDGIKTYVEIKSTDNLNQDTPAIMLSGNSSDEHKSLFTEAGFVDSLEKPIDQNKLANILVQFLS